MDIFVRSKNFPQKWSISSEMKIFLKNENIGQKMKICVKNKNFRQKWIFSSKTFIKTKKFGKNRNIYILWDKIARPHRKPFGLYYPLETCFSAESFHP